MLNHAHGLFPEFDERREIARLLKITTPQKRIAWLKWCCDQVSSGAVKTFIESTDGEVGSIWNSAMSLALGNGLSIEKAGEKLVEMVRNGSI